MPRFEYACHLRYGDLDTLGHLNNVEALGLLEQARVALFFTQATRDGVSSFDHSLVVVRHEIDYRKPVLYRPEPIIIELWVERVRASWFGVGYVVRDAETRYIDARSVLAAFDRTTGRARRLSSDERAWLETYTEPPSDTAG